LEPRKQQIPERDLGKSKETFSEVTSLEEFNKPEASMTRHDEQTEVITSLKLDSGNLADAIVFAEILGKPLALRDTYI